MPGNKSFLTKDLNDKIIHWNLKTGKILGQINSSGYISEFLKDSTQFVTINGRSLVIYDLISYKQIATIYPLKGNNLDYIILTPDGRYDGTPEGMKKLIHFVAGNEVIELEQLKERYYEPGLWQKLMGYSDEPLRKIKGLDRIRLYPEINLTFNEKEEEIKVDLTSQGGGIGKVNFFINGIEMKTLNGVSDFNPERKTSLIINLEDFRKFIGTSNNTFSVKAYNDEGWLVSRPEEIIYKRGESEDLEFVNFTGSAIPNFYGIVIGTSDYSGTSTTLKDLDYPDKDALAIAQTLDLAASNLFQDEENMSENKTYITLLNTDPNRDKIPKTAGIQRVDLANKVNIKQTFKLVAQKAQPEDVLVIYLSGHGTNFRKDGELDGQFYYLTRDMSGFNLQDEGIRNQYAISTEELIQWLNDIPAQKKVLIMDACASGKAIEQVDEILAKKDIPSSQKRVLELMKDRTGLFMISGSSEGAASYEASPYGQGLLTYSLLQGMTGPALQNREYLDVMSWFNYAANLVPDLAAEFYQIQQPQIAAPYKATSFPIGKIGTDDRGKIPLNNPRPFFPSKCISK